MSGISETMPVSMTESAPPLWTARFIGPLSASKPAATRVAPSGGRAVMSKTGTGGGVPAESVTVWSPASAPYAPTQTA